MEWLGIKKTQFEDDKKFEYYLELHLIPQDEKLWKMENFEEFIQARKK